MFSFTVKNQSIGVSDTKIASCLQSLAHQIGVDFAPIWGVYAHIIFKGKVYGVKAGPAIPSWPLYVQDNADVQGALGYHDIDANGVPFIKVFANDSVAAGVALPSVMSHEILEVLGDPVLESVTLSDNGDGTGMIFAAELCDPVEADTYQTPDGVALSNFVTPWWFDPKPPAGVKFDYLGNLKAPLTMTVGGYFNFNPITKAGGLTGWQQQFGAKARPWGGKSEGVLASKRLKTERMR